MAPFLRIALNAYDMGALAQLSDPPICAVKMKESVNTGTYISYLESCHFSGRGLKWVYQGHEGHLLGRQAIKEITWF